MSETMVQESMYLVGRRKEPIGRSFDLVFVAVVVVLDDDEANLRLRCCPFWPR
jgi:hypothetical protein